MQTNIATFRTHGTALTNTQYRIMLAEDDIEFRQLLARVLEADGYKVLQAADGHQLLERIAYWSGRGSRDADCHLIISDIRMPGCSGIEALSSLQRMGSRVPVVIMTAFGDEAMFQLAVKLGAAAFLAKPFNLDNLRTVVLNTLTNADARHLTMPNSRN